MEKAINEGLAMVFASNDVYLTVAAITYACDHQDLSLNPLCKFQLGMIVGISLYLCL